MIGVVGMMNATGVNAEKRKEKGEGKSNMKYDKGEYWYF